MMNFQKNIPLSLRASQPFRQPCLQTNSAICFLCLFDGLKIPSIRRLIRKPQTFGDLPLPYFNPSFYSPEGQQYLSTIYSQIFRKQCDCLVNPSKEIVFPSIQSHCRQSNNQRVILHYFGYGVHPPNDEETIYFFDKDHTNFQSVRIDQYIQSANMNPLLLIFDCNYSGLLLNYIAKARNTHKQDIIAFFSCNSQDQLPSSTENPSDLFSLCLVSSYQTSLWWYKKKHSKIFAKVPTEHLEKNQFLILFFDAILSAIAQSAVPRNEYYLLFNKDPTVSKVSKGFLLAQYIFKYFNVTPVSVPCLPDVSSHQLWEIYDIAIDLAINDQASLEQSIFDILVTSYTNYHNSTFLPLFSFFITVPKFQTNTSQYLLNQLDMEGGLDASLLHFSDFYSAIIQYKSPSCESVLLLAKLIALTQKFPSDSQWQFIKPTLNNDLVLKSEMLCVSIAIIFQCTYSFSRYSPECINKAKQCAPYSCILHGLLSEKKSGFSAMPRVTSSFVSLQDQKSSVEEHDSSFNSFVPLLDSSNSVEEQAAAIFAISYSKSETAFKYAMECTQSPHWLVRNEGVLALAKLFNLGCGQIADVQKRYEEMQDDKSALVSKNVKDLLSQIQIINTDNLSSEHDLGINQLLVVPESEILSLLHKSVEMPHFQDRYQNSIFSGLL